MIARRIICGFLAAVLTLLGACGGGGSSGTTTTVLDASIVALGPLSDDGGFTVNNTAYDVGRAVVEINGVAGSAADLRPGHIVRISGLVSGNGRARAERIEYDANVIGPLDFIDLSGERLIVMGQTVLLDTDTFVDPGLTGAVPGQTAEVSGFINSRGEVLATRIDLIPASGASRLIGNAADIDHANHLFRINGLTVDYSAAAVLDVPNGEIENDMELIIDGTLNESGVLAANRVDWLERDGSSFAGASASITGTITRYRSPSDFDVSGFATRTTATTEYTNGTAADLGAGARVRVSGELNTAGTLRAERITFFLTAGGTETVVYDFEDFSAVEIGGPFIATVDRGDEYVVEVTVNRHVVPLLDVKKAGTRLSVGFVDGANVNATTLRVRIVMPELSELTLAGATFATVSDFSGFGLDVLLAGAVLLDLRNSVYDTLNADLVGACAMLAEDTTVMTAARVDLTAASTATVNLLPAARLDGTLIASSALLYYGDGIDVNVSTDITSAVTRLGGSR